MISKIARPKKVLEIGTFTGYSALCLAESFQEGDEKLITIDRDKRSLSIANKYIEKSGLGDKVL